MKKGYRLYLLSATLCLIISSCATYQIPLDSFKTQMATIDSASLKTVSIRGPLGDKKEYKVNTISLIECIDKKGNPVKLSNGPSIEARITTSNGKKTIFYFDQLYIEQETLYGKTSRILDLSKSIQLADIVKIEIQDGKKKFAYAPKE